MKDFTTLNKNNISFYIACLILLLLVYFPLFGHLDVLTIRIWDESRLAINAYEMHKDGDWIVTHFDGKPDMWNTKPPLMIWLQTLSMKMIGVNELAVRLPSAFADLLTCLVLLWFSTRYLKNVWFAVISVAVLVTIPGYISEHSTRTGDYDALVTLFITLSALGFFLYVEYDRPKYLYIFFLSLILGVLTKGITILMFAPALLMYSLIRKKVKQILTVRNFYVGLAIFLFFTTGYYLLREHANPGYLKAVMENELGGRFAKVSEGNSGNFLYYIEHLINYRLGFWLLPVICGFIVGYLHKNEKIARLNIFIVILVFSYILIISISKTKLEWYDVPLFPFLSMVAAIPVWMIFEWLQYPGTLNRDLKKNPFPAFFLVFLFVVPYKTIVNRVIAKETAWGEDFYRADYYFRDALKGNVNLNNTYFLDQGYNPHHLFYIRPLQDKGTTIQYGDWKHLLPGNKVMTAQEDLRQYIQDHYSLQILAEDHNLTTYQITGIK